MEADAVTVSLDELTIDLSEEHIRGEGYSVTEDEKANSYAGLSQQNSDALESISDPSDRYILNSGDQSAQTEAGTGLADEWGNTDSKENDFEADVPSLLLFSSSRTNESDDSDSEFEVPERTNIPEQRIPTQLEISSPSHQENDLSLNEKETFHFQPEILTPRDKKTTDLIMPPENSIVAGYNKEAAEFKSLNEEEFPNPAHNVSNDSAYTTFSTAKVHVPHIIEEDLKPHNQPSASEITTEALNSDLQKPDIITTAEDWEGVATVEPGFLKHDEKSSGIGATYESKPLQTFSESWKDFESKDYSSVKGEIRTRIERKGFSAFTHMLFGPPKLHSDLIPQRDLIFCIAATPFNNESKEHTSVLQTVYRCLTGSKFDCQRYGSHWEEIGFQGKDPATDLRGAGMLALLHLLYFLRDPSTKDLARDVYKLSLHPTQNFPFCVMGINLSRICIQVLREEVYNRECNKRKDIIGTINNVYAALFLHLYKLWKQGKTIADSGFVIKGEYQEKFR
ncbi:Elmo domain-containing protein 3-like [Plakobranchus ocellatus]|uniref:Elmo domain-containing protein 3-like n=1 Tax=Plakobranchus ocellatus TaxID=259542 RepID=A0AAV4CG13_9GAST|nr:Elmo domain-containing protein 3-like [Plakobranchus ocellatus]